jgi:hypothetical protein
MAARPRGCGAFHGSGAASRLQPSGRSGGPAPSWQLVQTFNTGTDWPDYSYPAAQSANDVWVTGQQHSSESPLVVHWNGTSWQQIATPSGFAQSGPVTALSATSMWTFSSIFKGNRTTWYALNWNGSSWKSYMLSTSTANSLGYNMTGAAAFSTTNVWAFGELPQTNNPLGGGQFGPPFAARWNGKAWVQVSMPGTVGLGLSALSPDDIWAFGPTKATAGRANETMIGMHWNGTSWSTLAVPLYTLSGHKTQLYSMLADGPDSVWAVENVGYRSSTGLLPGFVLAHWNGSAWQEVTTDTSDVASYAIADGHGGLWIPSEVYKTLKHTLLHYSGGTLATAALPVYDNYIVQFPSALALIPGSDALLDPATLQPRTSKGHWQGAIFESQGS